jgi:predicted HAD superfamily Cof-like phosphohydrolase
MKMMMYSKHMSNAQVVKEFTQEAQRKECPKTPLAMDRKGVEFIVKMVMSELCELACTVTETPGERDELMQNALDTRDKCVKFEYANDTSLIAAQFDALVDSWYYSLDTAARHGVNMSKIFDIVHGANMAKRDPETGLFLHRESDGKIIKPVGWKSPDIDAEIERQKTEGSW